jgi:hypothetical protein
MIGVILGGGTVDFETLEAIEASRSAAPRVTIE